MTSEQHGGQAEAINMPAPEVAAAPVSQLEQQQIPESKSVPIPAQQLDQHDVEWRYMDFSSDIPTYAVRRENSDIVLPLCPDLRKYDSPFEWPRFRKKWMTYLSCSVNAIAAYASGSYASPEEQLRQKWNVSHVTYNLGITVFTIGFGVAPMILAPFSEVNGRKPVFVATGILFVAMQVACALTPTFAGMIVCRLLMGIGGSTFSTMVGGILADIWVSKERNTAMVLFTGATLFGTGLGPLVSGVVAENLLWRWVFYIQIITSGCLVALVTLFFQETRGSIILSRKAKAVNKWYEELESLGVQGMRVDPQSSGPQLEMKTSQSAQYEVRRIRFRVLADDQRASLRVMISQSLYRPIHMLFTEPVVFFFSLWISFAWAILYLQFGSVPLVYRTVYGFSLSQTGYVFTAMCAGGIIGTVLCIWQETFMNTNFPHRMLSPEGRLLPTCIGAAFLPVSLFWFGWTSFSEVHWIVPTISICFATLAIFWIFLAVFNYSADAYHHFTSSALAASGKQLFAELVPSLTHM
jgi:multidrug resistance protein